MRIHLKTEIMRQLVKILEMSAATNFGKLKLLFEVFYIRFLFKSLTLYPGVSFPSPRKRF